MNYRSKRTFVATGEEAPVSQKKQPHSISTSSDSSLATSSKSSDPSTQKWGPFRPPTLGVSQSFGYLSEPIKQPTTAKKPTSSTPSPSVVAPQSSMPQSTSMPSKLQLKTLSKPLFTQSQPSSNPSQQSFSSTLTGASQPQRKVDQSRWSQPPLFPNLIQRAAERAAQQPLEPHKATQQPVKATQQPVKTTQQPIKATQQPQKATQKPIASSFTSAKPHVEKSAYVAPMGATKQVLSRPPPTSSETIAGNKNRTRKTSFSQSIPNCHRQVPPTDMHASENTLHRERSPSPIHVESEAMPNHSLDELEESASESEEELAEGGGRDTSVKKSKPRRRSIVPNWPNLVEFDEKEEVVAIDADGKRHLVRGSVQPRDVWNDAPGFKYFVKFNEFNQPLRKGGSILVSFLGDVAKRDTLCPVGVKTWRDLNKKFKSDVVTLVRAHFVIPEGKVINDALLRRTDKSWKHHRYILKRDYFDPTKTPEQNYDNLPDGVSSKSWTFLVDYWLSPEGQKLSQLGKDARASQGHFHKSGATSFANRRADLKEKKGEFSELDFYKAVYVKEDGSFKEGTLSSQFMEDANFKVQENLASSSSSKSRVEIENEVFNKLMYKGEVPKRPLNYGFGVKQSDIFGVEGLLRKEGCSYADNSAMEMENLKVELSVVKKQNEDLALQNQVLDTKFDETTQAFKMIASYLGQVLKEVRKGNVSSELLDGAESAIHLINDDSGGNNGKK